MYCWLSSAFLRPAGRHSAEALYLSFKRIKSMETAAAEILVSLHLHNYSTRERDWPLMSSPGVGATAQFGIASYDVSTHAADYISEAALEGLLSAEMAPIPGRTWVSTCR